ncbi:MAG: hypothetical protein ACRELF_15375, partial [Gemmataceae bacterium]
IEAMRVAGETGTLHYDADKFQVVLNPEGPSSVQVRMNLSNVYAEYRGASRSGRRAVIERYVRAAREVEVPTGLAQVREHLVPRVRTRCYYSLLDARLRLQDAPSRPMVYRPLAEHLAVGLAVDQKDGIMEVFGDMLHEWGLGVEEAFALARDNLRRMSARGLQSLAPGLYFSPWCDNHDASRLILDDLVRDCEVKGDYVAVVPNRDTLLVTGSDDVAGLQAMLQVTEGVLRDKPRPMSGIPVRLRRGVWEPYAPEDFHPELGHFRFLRLQSQAQDYGEQKELLDQLHVKMEKDVFVASFSVVQNKETGALRSYCVWSDGLDALLPRADRVFFMRIAEEGEGAIVANAGWEHVEEVVGTRIKPTEDYPPRYHVESFPTADELQRIGMEDVA